MGSLVSAKEIRAACETEKCESEKSMGIRSDVGGRRFAWAKHYTVPESAYMDADDTATSGEAMSERFQKMRANNQPEPEPEPEPAEDESLADVRAENAMAAMEIKRLRAELEQLHSAGGPGALLSPAEQVSLDEAAEKLGNREARLDLRLQEISREKDAADNVLKASQAEVRSHDVRLHPSGLRPARSHVGCRGLSLSPSLAMYLSCISLVSLVCLSCFSYVYLCVSLCVSLI